MMPKANTHAMQAHLDEISIHVAQHAHAVVLMDRAGWHTTGKLKLPANITIILLPSRSPELNPVENIWQYLRQNWLSNRVFPTYDDILDAGCEAWRRLIARPIRMERGNRRTHAAGGGRRRNRPEQPYYAHPMFWAPFVVVGEGGVPAG